MRIIFLLYPIVLLVWSGYLLNDFVAKKKELQLQLLLKNPESRRRRYKDFLQLIYIFVACVFQASCALEYPLVFILNISIY